MPTPAQIVQVQADLAAAVAANITPAQMVAILDVAIAYAVSKGDVTVSYTMAGNTVQRSLDQAQRLRAYYQTEADRLAAKAAPVVVMSVEFCG